jgi:N-acetylglutamate synthase-like GNAT family acetyltransferase
MRNILIRKVEPKDIDRIHDLSQQLGYSIDRQELKNNVQTILSHQDYQLVVITEDDFVFGWMSLNIRHAVEMSSFMQITAIVVDENKRGLGYGKKLIDFAENQALKWSLKKMALYSNNKRIEAHQFYQAQGFIKTKDSSWFAKDFI